LLQQQSRPQRSVFAILLFVIPQVSAGKDIIELTMARPKSILRYDQVVQSIHRISAERHAPESTAHLEALMNQPIAVHPDTRKNPRMKKFRFQLLQQWLVECFEPCRVADIGGGKGLLSYLLLHSGWDVTVIDPEMQALPSKFKDIASQTRVKIGEQAAVPYIQAPFSVELARGFDLLVAMHAHGCNAAIIEAAAQYGCGFAIFPCCVIDEPFYPPRGVLWLESLAHYAVQLGVPVYTVRLNFKGQNVGLYSPGRCKRKSLS
jgi:hypothetical protein